MTPSRRRSGEVRIRAARVDTRQVAAWFAGIELFFQRLSGQMRTRSQGQIFGEDISRNREQKHCDADPKPG